MLKLTNHDIPRINQRWQNKIFKTHTRTIIMFESYDVAEALALISDPGILEAANVLNSMRMVGSTKHPKSGVKKPRKSNKPPHIITHVLKDIERNMDSLDISTRNIFMDIKNNGSPTSTIRKINNKTLREIWTRLPINQIQ